MTDKELSSLLNIAIVNLNVAKEESNWRKVLAYALRSIAASQLIIAERSINKGRTPNKKKGQS